jgi:hypothetical protein
MSASATATASATASESLCACAVCGKSFTKKSGLTAHSNRKIPCKAPVALLEVAVGSALTEAGLPHLVECKQEFRETSVKFNKSLSKETRLDQGIFFTPKKARDLLFACLDKLGVAPAVVLEPSFGSGEFVLDARRLWPKAHVVGVEKNTELFKAVACPGATLVCGDFLDWTGSADVIIGNPPYFVMPTDGLSLAEKKAFAAKHVACMTGRPNIYVLFLHKCLSTHLTSGGFLAFIIPTSLYNCSYYQPMRDYIYAHTYIRHLETLDKPGFYETGQETMLIVLQKKGPEVSEGGVVDKYIYKSKSGNIYISPHYKELYALTKGTQTLADLGLGAKTGNVVWNQVKPHLADKGTLLVYSSNINNCTLTVDNLHGDKRKQYVGPGVVKPKLSGPVILVERGYGNSFSFNSVLVELKDFYAENHINVIYPKVAGAELHLGRVLKSFQDARSIQFVKWFIGNGSISATDLETHVPIF